MLQDSTKKISKARLFVCFEFEPDYFILLQERFRSLSGCGKLKLVKNFHMTLRYFGNVDRKKIPILVNKLSTIQFQPFDVKSSYLGYFDKNLPKVIFAGFEKNDNFALLKNQFDNLFSKEKFHPHVTLARLKNIKDISFVKGILDNMVLESTKNFSINKFFLMESNLTNFGPIYRVIETFEANR